MTVASIANPFTSLSMVQSVPLIRPSVELSWGGVFDVLVPAAMSAGATVDAVREWHRVRYAGSSGPSRDRLFDYALRRLRTGAGFLVPQAQLEQVLLLLREIIADAQPTPQLAVGEDGAIETLWIVNETEVALTIELDGSGSLTAYASDDPVFEYEFDGLVDPLDREQIAEARRLLNGLGESVTHPVFV